MSNLQNWKIVDSHAKFKVTAGAGLCRLAPNHEDEARGIEGKDIRDFSNSPQVLVCSPNYRSKVDENKVDEARLNINKEEKLVS